MTDRLRLPDPLGAAERLPPGSAVILRDAGWEGRSALGRALRKICRRKRLVFLVAGDEGWALRLGADGIHWPERLVRRRRRSKRLRYVSAAAHGLAGAIKASRSAADFVLLSPVFPTESHPGRPALGPCRFAALLRHAAIPALALGGITAATAPGLRGSRASGYAAIGALTTSTKR